MIDWWLFVPACFAMNLTFGPSNLLAMTHGAAAGPAYALRAGTGRLLAFVPLLALSGLGMGLVLMGSAVLFTALKVAGAAYLVWLGWGLLRQRPQAGGMPAPTQAAAFRREALTALGNPKAMLIFAAFLPQFVVPGDYALSFAMLAATYLALEAVALVLYAAAGRFAARAAASRLHWIQRGSGAAMIGFGLLLLFARRPGAA